MKKLISCLLFSMLLAEFACRKPPPWANDPRDIRNYGAKCDGTTSDATLRSVQLAISRAREAGQKDIKIPNGCIWIIPK